MLGSVFGQTFHARHFLETQLRRILPMAPSRDQSITGTSDTPRRRWVIACLLGFGVLVNYFDRVNLSVSKDALNTAFGVSAVTFGYLSSAYNWTYAALQIPSGLLLDRFGVKHVGRWSTILWAVASFGAAVSTGIGSFLAA